MKQIYSVLSTLGLSENEVKVYVEAIKHEKIAPYTLARAIGVPRTTVYDVMLNLALKGLITIRQSQGLEKQQTWIEAKNPSTLRDMIFKQRKKLTQTEVNLIDVLPLLKGEYSKHVQNTNFTFYSGIEGAKQVMNQTLKAQGNSTLRVFESLMPMDTLGKKLINEDVDSGLRSKRTTNTSIKSLIALNKWTKHVLSYQHKRNKDYITLHNFRFIDNPLLSINLDISLLEDTVRCICTQDNEAWGLVVKSGKLATTLASIFDILWTIAKEITEKDIGQWGINEFFEAEKRNNLRK
ncbi:MAG: helix-turn-helix domain-containing protein [bacterium]